MTEGRDDRLGHRPAGVAGAHHRNMPRREALAARFGDPSDPFRIVMVRDM